MKHFNQLDNVETQIIRLGELKNLYNVVSNGMESSNLEQIKSSVQYIEGSLEDICEKLKENYQILFDAIANDTNEETETKPKRSK